MLRSLAVCTLFVLTVSVGAHAAAPRIEIDFYTPSRAVMCWEDYHEIQLACYTPNDGFSLFMYPTGRVPRNGDEHPFSGSPVKNPTYGLWKRTDFNYKTGGLLNFGYRWTEWQALKRDYVCNSEKGGLTCKNRSGHGWWIGRFKGYRVLNAVLGAFISTLIAGWTAA